MNTTRAILYGALMWVLIFFEVSILVFGFKMSAADLSYKVIHSLLLAIIVLVVSAFYFSKRGTKGGIMEGLKVGLMFLITGIVLDSLITIPLFKAFDYAGFLLDPMMLIGFVESVAVVMVVGAVKK